MVCHIELMPKEKWVSKCRELEVEGKKERSRGMITWQLCVEEDMERLGLNKSDVIDSSQLKRWYF